jgi:hypothetical protein
MMTPCSFPTPLLTLRFIVLVVVVVVVVVLGPALFEILCHGLFSLICGLKYSVANGTALSYTKYVKQTALVTPLEARFACFLKGLMIRCHNTIESRKPLPWTTRLEKFILVDAWLELFPFG